MKAVAVSTALAVAVGLCSIGLADDCGTPCPPPCSKGPSILSKLCLPRLGNGCCVVKCEPACPEPSDPCDPCRPSLLDRLRSIFACHDECEPCPEPKPVSEPCDPCKPSLLDRLRSIFACHDECEPCPEPACEPCPDPCADPCAGHGLLSRLRGLFHSHCCEPCEAAVEAAPGGQPPKPAPAPKKPAPKPAQAGASSGLLILTPAG